LIIATLFKSTGSTLWISVYVSIALCLTLISRLADRETARLPLEN
jgi:hypothetical protein